MRPSISIRLLFPLEKNANKIEGVLIHEMFHSATDLQDKLLFRIGNNEFFLLSSTDGHAITRGDMAAYRKALESSKSTVDINNHLQDFNVSIVKYAPKNKNLLAAETYINNGTAEMSIELAPPRLNTDVPALSCLMEALTDFATFQMRFVSKLAKSKQLSEENITVLERPFKKKVNETSPGKKADDYYYKIAYKTETSAFVKCALEYLLHTKTVDLIRGALTIEGQFRLYDKLMEEPALRGKNGRERLLRFAQLVYTENEKLKLDAARKARH